MKYDKKSDVAKLFINDEEIVKTMFESTRLAKDESYVLSLIEKAARYEGLTYKEASVLSFVEEETLLQRMFDTARKIKKHIYGNRIVMFAPLYLSDYCVNECRYCAFHHASVMDRRRLTQEEIIEQVRVLEKMGHKRLALETGEDPVNSSIDYLLESIKTIYSIKSDNGEIRRVNVNIAATTVENYRKLKEAGIGTYILFQETYHLPTYEYMHPKGPKRDYEYHTTAHDRAMRAGIDDVGLGVLYGLYDWRYDIVGQIMHAEHLEAVYGVGPHTLSMVRIRDAGDIKKTDYEHAVSDDDFKRIVAILRMAVPYTGMIISTREGGAFRSEVIDLGISQVSAGSCTSVGGYTETQQQPQFEIEDHRPPIEVTKDLISKGYIPSFCTACYREGRTGDRFMRLAKTGQIGNICQPNALITLKEYAEDYGDEEMKHMTDVLISNELEKIPDAKAKELTAEYIKQIERGERDFRL